MAQTTTREFWVSDNVEDAVRKTKITLKKLGDLTAVVPGQHVVGNVAFGVRNVSLKIAWRPEMVEANVRIVSPGDPPPIRSFGTLLLIQGELVGHGMAGNDAALRNAFERFEDAYLHFDRADYQPDRLGLLPATVIGILVLLVLVAVLISRRTDLFKPGAMPSPAASADALRIAP